MFSDAALYELKTIKYGSLITLKHVATGKYLSSCETGSYHRLVSIFIEFLINLYNLSIYTNFFIQNICW